MNNRKFRNWLRRSGYEDYIQKRDSIDIQAIIGGDRDSIMSSFAWGSMPQGSDFWQEKFRGGRLSKRTRQFLAKLRDEARRRGC